jgi:very-short-patch-repair endonuclease
MQLRLIDDFASRHHGLITSDRARQLGVSRSAWYRAIASEALEQIHPTVARLRGSPETWEQQALAAVWAAGHRALASHRTSARLWGIDRTDSDPIDVLLPARTRQTSLPGVVAHRPRDLLDLRPILRQRIPTTNPLRMLLDLGAVDHDAVPDALAHVLASRVASPAAVRSALARHGRKGRHGVTALRQALEGWLGEDLPPDSVLEARMADMLRRHRLPPVRFHARVAGFEVDFLVVDTNVILECDGWGSHGLDRDQFEFDRLRNAELTAAGYVVVQFTWRQLDRDPLAVAERLIAVLRRWAPHVLA